MRAKKVVFRYACTPEGIAQVWEDPAFFDAKLIDPEKPLSDILLIRKFQLMLMISLPDTEERRLEC